MADTLIRVLTDPDHVMRDFREDLAEIWAAIDCWEEDRRCNLMPTESSLARAKAKVEAIRRRIGR